MNYKLTVLYNVVFPINIPMNYFFSTSLSFAQYAAITISSTNPISCLGFSGLAIGPDGRVDNINYINPKIRI